MKRTRSSEAILTKMKRKRSSEASLSMETKPESDMVRVGIRVFLDSEELEDGEEISEVLKAVNESRICIPIFSQNFASSSWCLREVARMVECILKSDPKKEIIPIFYDVKADDAKLKTDLYKKAILKHKEKVGSDELERWESALVEIGGRIGRELMGKRQGEEIDSIVEQVSRKLNTRHMSVTEHFVEDSIQVEAIMKLLDVGSDSVLFVGIHGMGGVGKTTLTKFMFNKLSSHFEGCCFLDDV
ncbi:TMV resistance protein N-like isoform X2 [Eucalyptus grandis]|uniref:TMV resistance protein N-like isoform X2 n=1 Tax=Eucalyptus grandis TaxID=71139 RepID=UPI00192EE5F4|nr:TMV resistance protein N-like isoform X2 [Eucalyptus grandis]